MKPPLVMDPNELITTKRIINHRTKQIETRVQRQIVIEDGKVISDTGPLVTTKTLEDSKEEVDEQVETKYAYCPHHNHWPSTVTRQEHQTQTPVESKSNPIKTFVFGGEERRAEKEQPPEPETTKPQQIRQISRPSKTFYFGQKNITDDDENKCNNKEKENMQLRSDSGASTAANYTKGNVNGSSIPKQTGNEEKDCQFVYEYSDFSRCG